jgi:hypothetical protein
MAEATPIETYEDGEVLEADEYEPGAVVILRQETLAGPAGGIAADIQEYSTLPIPARPLDVSPSFGSDNNTTKVIKDGKIIYFTTTRWGIVAVNKMGRKVLHTISTEQVDKHDDGKVLVANFTPLTCEFPLQIGETRHFRARRRFFERLKRVNILDIIAYGEAERNLEVSKALQLS